MSDDYRDVGEIRHALSTLRVPGLIVLGAFVGANLRYGVGLQISGVAGTLVANVVGSALLGALLFEGAVASGLSREARLLFGTGLLSSFTTYSTFAVEAATVAPAIAAVYVVASYGLGLVGVLAGRAFARRLTGGEP